MQKVKLPSDINKFVKLRHLLHRNAETAGEEKVTNNILNEFISTTSPDLQIDKIGGYGLAAVYNGQNPGKTVLIRADIDALPIEEINDFEYRSQNSGRSHKCGHDGHSTILSYLGEFLGANRPKKGNVVLLFQPAEETGDGAAKVLADKKFSHVKPDLVFGFHNLPGFNKNEIIIKDGVFAAASRGYIARLEGKTSHAAEPENGISPAPALAEIITETYSLVDNTEFSDLTLLTIIHARLGEIAFGTSPGYAEYMATLRAFENEDIEKLNKQVSEICKEVTGKYSLSLSEELTEVFPATVNDRTLADSIREVGLSSGYELNEIRSPFKWSEDFGHFTSNYPGCYFGIGAGKDVSQLHNPDYDFPDEIIPGAGLLLINLLKKHSG
ncbi:MAG: peptidase M20 [Melioribacteraceae bacterium]|nr:MAG: peptidase M20 [Melioribacteraceae bacterium]